MPRRLHAGDAILNLVPREAIRHPRRDCAFGFLIENSDLFSTKRVYYICGARRAAAQAPKQLRAANSAAAQLSTCSA
jgi:hypothetical protein